MGLALRPGRGLGRAGACRRASATTSPRASASPSPFSRTRSRRCGRRTRCSSRCCCSRRRATGGGCSRRRCPRTSLVELQSGVPMAMVLGWYASNCSEALIGAGLVRAFVPGPLRLDTLRSAGIFLSRRGLAAPLVSSFLDAALVQPHRLGREAATGTWCARASLSNVLAELTVVPLILTWAAWLPAARGAVGARCAEIAALFAGLLPACMVVFDLPLIEPHTAPALFYAPLPFLLWAAVRFGPAGTASALARDGGGDDLGRGQRPRPVRRQRAAGDRARHAAFPERGRGAAAAARRGARARAPGSSSSARAAPAAHASFARGDAGRALRRHRPRAEPAAHRDPQQRAGGAALPRRQVRRPGDPGARS